MNIVLIGAPGCGKGTQSKLICEKYNLVRISTGDLFRRIIALDTPLGRKIKPMMSKYVPDDIVLEVLEDRLSRPDCENGVIFDGFPRTLNQAKMLTDRIKIDKVINFEIDLNETKKRILNRRVCTRCGATFMVDTVGDTCPNCGSIVDIRDEDRKVDERIATYVENFSPIVDYYNDLGLLYTIDVNKYSNLPFERSVNAVFEEVKKTLEG